MKRKGQPYGQTVRILFYSFDSNVLQSVSPELLACLLRLFTTYIDDAVQLLPAAQYLQEFTSHITSLAMAVHLRSIYLGWAFCCPVYTLDRGFAGRPAVRRYLAQKRICLPAGK